MTPDDERIWNEIVAAEAPGLAWRADWWRLVYWTMQTRNRPRLATGFLIAAVLTVLLVVIVINVPVESCRLHVVTAPGEQPHWACERGTS